MPLLESGQLRTVNGEFELAPGIVLEPTGGHSPGHQVVRISSEGHEALYPGDLVPTTAHLKPNWLMSWDLDPAVTYSRKVWLLEEAARKGTLVFWSHDPRLSACRVEKAGDGYAVAEGTEMEARP